LIESQASPPTCALGILIRSARIVRIPLSPFSVQTLNVKLCFWIHFYCLSNSFRLRRFNDAGALGMFPFHSPSVFTLLDKSFSGFFLLIFFHPYAQHFCRKPRLYDTTGRAVRIAGALLYSSCYGRARIAAMTFNTETRTANLAHPADLGVAQGLADGGMLYRPEIQLQLDAPPYNIQEWALACLSKTRSWSLIWFLPRIVGI